jgi:hypothetical protein
LGFKEDYLIKFLNCNKHRIDLDGSINLDAYMETNGINPRNKMFYIDIEKINAKAKSSSVADYFPAANNRETPAKLDKQPSRPSQSNDSAKRIYEETLSNSGSENETTEEETGITCVFVCVYFLNI